MSAIEAPVQPSRLSEEELCTPDAVVAAMCEIAPSGSCALDYPTTQVLTEYTQRLIEMNGAEAGEEYNRYKNIRQRELELPHDKLSKQLAHKTILVTGGTGVIGSALLEEITKYSPGTMVSLSIDEPNPAKTIPEVDYRLVDIRDRQKLCDIMQELQPDIIYHVAADKYNHEAETRAAHTITTNIDGTQNVIEASEAAGVPQIVYASTGKASRPYAPDVYAASKKTSEWLLAQAAERGKLLCSAARFTHVVDDSSLLQKFNSWIDGGEPLMLQDPDVWFYVQSAKESAQLLLNVGLDAEPGTFLVQAIRDLGVPINLLLLGEGAIVEKGIMAPIYFRGTIPGYEEQVWPYMYDIESAGDVSPLLNVIEAEEVEISKSCPAVDSFRLNIANTFRINRRLSDLQIACQTGKVAYDLRGMLQELSWAMLDARLDKIGSATLRRVESSILKTPSDRRSTEPDHIRTSEAFISALALRNIFV